MKYPQGVHVPHRATQLEDELHALADADRFLGELATVLFAKSLIVGLNVAVLRVLQ